MRTLKKALCLVLVLAMVLSLGVTAFAVDKAADYTDYSTVTSKEAVDVLTAIGVLNGNTDGSFGPTGNFTRAQAATIIAHMMLGTKTAAAVPQVATQFNDVSAAHWASGYINYCVNNGIINGYGDGRFGPEDTLTATQWALMLLNALGYQPKYEGIGGAGWEIKTTTLAVSAGVADAEELTGTFNRDVAAQMALNTLQATLVSYNQGLNIDVTTGDAHVSINTAEPKATPIVSTVGYEGNINDTRRFTNNGQSTLTVEFGEKYFTNLRLVDDDQDAFNRPANTWTYLGKTVGSYAQKPVLEYTTSVSKATLYKDMRLAKAKGAEFYVNGVEGTFTMDNKVQPKDEIGKDSKNNPIYGLMVERGTDAGKSYIGGNGTLTQVYAIETIEKDGTSNTEYVITCIDSYVGDVTSKVAATASRDAYVYVTTRQGTSGTFNTTEFAVDDVVIYTYSEKKGADGKTPLGIQSVEKAETVTGTLTKYTENKSLVAGDKTYSYSKHKASTANDGVLKTDVTVVLDKYGYAIDVKGTTSADKYAVVINFSDGVGYWNKTPAAQLVLADGTIVEEAQLAKNPNSKDGSYGETEFQTGDIVSYTVNSKDKYTLTLKANVNTNSDTKAEGSAAPLYIKNGEYQMANILGFDGTKDHPHVLANGSTIFIVRSESDGESIFKVYNGIKNMPTVRTKDYNTTTNTGTDKTDATVFCKSGNVATVVYIDSVGTKTTTDSNNVVYVNYDKNVKLVNESGVGEYYAYQAIVNGEIVNDFKVGKADKTLNNVDTYQMYTNVTYNNGIAELDDENRAELAFGIEKVANDVLGFGTSYGDPNYAAYVTASNCKVFVKDVAGGLSESSVSAVIDSHLDKVWYTLNANKQVTYVVIEKAEEDAKEEINVSVASAHSGSQNIQLVFWTEVDSTPYFLTPVEIKELGINDSMIKDLMLGSKALTLKASASEKDKGYNWNNTAICIMNGADWGLEADGKTNKFVETYGPDAGFMKLHTDGKVTLDSGKLSFTIDDIGTFEFTVNPATLPMT